MVREDCDGKEESDDGEEHDIKCSEESGREIPRYGYGAHNNA